MREPDVEELGSFWAPRLGHPFSCSLLLGCPKSRYWVRVSGQGHSSHANSQIWVPAGPVPLSALRSWAIVSSLCAQISLCVCPWKCRVGLSIYLFLSYCQSIYLSVSQSHPGTLGQSPRLYLGLWVTLSLRYYVHLFVI